MITGAVFLRDKTVGQAMTKLKDVYMLSVDLVLTPNVVRTIFKKGFSRIPIYKEKRNKIVSILFLKVSNLNKMKTKINLDFLNSFF